MIIMAVIRKNIRSAFYQFFIPCEDNHFRPKSLESRAFFVYILVALALKLGIMSFLTVLPRTFFYADVTRTTLVSLTNDARKANGLPALQENPVLEAAAKAKAEDILNKGYFAHQ